MANQQITDVGPGHKYFWQTPNMIDEAGLSVYAFRLYAHYKRQAGEHGLYRQGMRKMAGMCRMSPMAISRARQELVTAGFIHIIPGDKAKGVSDAITIIDIWPENMTKYGKQPVPGEIQVDTKPVPGEIQVDTKPVPGEIHIHKNINIRTKEKNIRANAQPGEDCESKNPGQEITSSLNHAPIGAILNPENNISPPRGVASGAGGVAGGAVAPNLDKDIEQIVLSHIRGLLVRLWLGDEITEVERAAIMDKTKCVRVANAARKIYQMMGADFDESFARKVRKYWLTQWRGKDGARPEPEQVRDMTPDVKRWKEKGETNGKTNTVLSNLERRIAESKRK